MEINREDAKRIINIHLNKIGNFCINTCKAQCCQRGALVLLNQDEVNMIVGKKLNYYIKNQTLTQNIETKNYYYNLTKYKCKNLNKKFICKIHSKKPRVCTDYPIFIVNNFIITANDCPAIEEGLLKECIIELENLGFKII